MSYGIQCCDQCGKLTDGHTGPANLYLCAECSPVPSPSGGEPDRCSTCGATVHEGLVIYRVPAPIASPPISGDSEPKVEKLPGAREAFLVGCERGADWVAGAMDWDPEKWADEYFQSPAPPSTVKETK